MGHALYTNWDKGNTIYRLLQGQILDYKRGDTIFSIEGTLKDGIPAREGCVLKLGLGVCSFRTCFNFKHSEMVSGVSIFSIEGTLKDGIPAHEGCVLKLGLGVCSFRTCFNFKHSEMVSGVSLSVKNIL